MTRRAWSAALAASLAFSVGCGDASKRAPMEPDVPTRSEGILKELLAAPDSLVIDRVSYDVVVDLNRDFMPFSPPDGKPLTANVLVTAVGQSLFPEEITGATIWVFQGDEIWSSAMESRDDAGDPGNQRSYSCGGGPLWTPGLLVDVVFGLRTSPSTIHLVRLHDVPIHRSV